MTKHTKWLSLALAALMLLTSLASCASSDELNGTDTVDTTATETADPNADTRFSDVNYGGREFHIYTSANQATALMESSNYLIEGEEAMGGGLVSDAVFTRNLTVEEQLGVELVFTQCKLGAGSIAGDIRILTQSGMSEFDLVINDNYDYAPMVLEGHFRNVLDENCEFDFDRNYWYKDYMEDLRLVNGYQYLLAGDFFIDVLRTAHLMVLNKELYQDYYHTSADEIYDVVSNFEWTYDKLISIITGLYIDKNQNGVKDAGDQFGYIDADFWGASIPMSTSGTTNFITRNEDGIPSVTIHEGDRANLLANAMGRLLNDDATGRINGDVPMTSFINGEALVAAGGMSLGSLESETLRQMEADAAVLPYPMLFASDQKYTTATHDTTELGGILVTATDMEFISTVVEVLNRETANILIPKYYKECIQLQCVDDEKAAAMIDIIHDNFDNAFILSYNQALGNGKILISFSDAAQAKREFSAVFAGSAKGINRALTKTIGKYMDKCNIS